MGAHSDDIYYRREKSRYEIERENKEAYQKIASLKKSLGDIDTQYGVVMQIAWKYVESTFEKNIAQQNAKGYFNARLCMHEAEAIGMVDPVSEMKEKLNALEIKLKGETQ